MFNFYSFVHCSIKRRNGCRVREHQIRGSPSILVTNTLRYLLHFAPGRKLFELKRIFIFVLCVPYTAVAFYEFYICGLCLVILDCQKCFEAKHVLRTKHEGKRYSIPTPTPSFYNVGIYRINTRRM